jgi:hypothetical protein
VLLGALVALVALCGFHRNAGVGVGGEPVY